MHTHYITSQHKHIDIDYLCIMVIQDLTPQRLRQLVSKGFSIRMIANEMNTSAYDIMLLCRNKDYMDAYEKGIEDYMNSINETLYRKKKQNDI